MEFQKIRLKEQQQSEAHKRKQEAWQKQVKLNTQKRRQESRLKLVSEHWDETTKEIVFKYIEFIKLELKGKPLDMAFFDSIIECAENYHVVEGKPVDGIPDFAERVCEYWENRVDSETSSKSQKMPKAYQLFASRMEGKIESKSEKFWSNLDIAKQDK